MKKALTIFTGFVHDFAAGCWAASVFATYWIDKKTFQHYEIGQIVAGLKRELFYTGLGCVAVVLLTGIGRTFTYANVLNIYGENSEELRRRMLILKHVMLLIIFGSGIYWQWSMTFR
jgi:hypothetical protein